MVSAAAGATRSASPTMLAGSRPLSTRAEAICRMANCHLRSVVSRTGRSGPSSRPTLPASRSSQASVSRRRLSGNAVMGRA